MRTIWYMGAKTRITDSILEAVDAAAPEGRRVLDLMSGTGVVARTLADRYRVHANDVQRYAQTIASAYLEPTLGFRVDLERDLGDAFRENLAPLREALLPALALEQAYLEGFGFEASSPSVEVGPRLAWELPSAALTRARRQVPGDDKARGHAYRSFALRETPCVLEGESVRGVGAFAGFTPLLETRALAARRLDPSCFPYQLATTYYPNVYLGLRQAIEVDSLRYAIDQLRGPRAEGKRRLYLAALLHAASVATSATSHFCQPRGLVRDSEVRAVLARRALSIPSRMAAYAAEILAGQASRGGRNRTSAADWRDLYRGGIDVDAVYADPPYTADNYSRFYHVLEVLVDYDYPELSKGGKSKGRYPLLSRRHRSPFCVKRSVERELRELVLATAHRGAALVLSYGEENGLLLRTYRDRGASAREARKRFVDLARLGYQSVELRTRELLHSGQGDSNHRVTELLLVARDPRPQEADPCA
ncbi:MAG: DNA adenine methylase [Planctomycetes bacterium]|nr:DNA adenine methylase [Planctomycetota bacterium]